MATLRELKGRIGSVASSEKITGAMKMISSAKMHKAEAALRRLLPFRNQIEAIIANLLGADAPCSSPLTVVPDRVEHATVVILGSDDGLCGAYNVNLFKFLLGHIADLRDRYGEDLHINIVTVGKKMDKAVRKIATHRISVEVAAVNSKAEGDAVKAFNDELQRRFLAGETGRIDIIYQNFKSISRQRPVASPMLPLSVESFSTGAAAQTSRPYIFEPDATSIFATVLPMYLLALMQEVFGENRASEQAARVMAMQSANDNAKKLLEQLRLEYNKLRQQSITNELLDIVGGQVRD